MQSSGTGSCTSMACDFVCQNCNPWSGARDNFFPAYSILVVLPIAVLMHFPWHWKVVTEFFFIWTFSKRVEKCEEDCLSSLLAFSSSCNESLLKDGLDVESTSSMDEKLFPIVWNYDVTHQFRCDHVSTSVSLNCTNVHQNFGNSRNTRTSSCYFLHRCFPFWEISRSSATKFFRPSWMYSIPMNVSNSVLVWFYSEFGICMSVHITVHSSAYHDPGS